MIRLTSVMAVAALFLAACTTGGGRDFGDDRDFRDKRTPTFGSSATVTGGSVRGGGS